MFILPPASKDEDKSALADEKKAATKGKRLLEAVKGTSFSLNK